MRQRKLKWADDFLKNSSYLIKEFPYVLKDGTNELEIGCGKGGFIFKKALTNPNINYIGVEIQSSCLAIGIKKSLEAELKNVRYCNVNAKELNEKFTGKFDTIYLNFSDPWPKARHEKRRLTYEGFLEVYYNILKDDGYIIFRTDNKGLFDYSLESFKNSKYFVLEEFEEDCKLKENEIISEYESKFRELGNPIYRLKAKKKLGD